MVRKSKISAEEIEEIEFAEFDRRQVRGKGLDLMSVRDRGWGHIRDHRGRALTMSWHVNAPPQEGIARNNIPPGMFMLEGDGIRVMFDADEFRKFLRWV
jgi:hypothetical protein